MRLGLWLPRLSHLRVLGPVAAVAAQRDWQVLAFCPKGGPKNDAWQRPGPVSRVAHVGMAIEGAQETEETILAWLPDVILSASVKVPDWLHPIMAATKRLTRWGAIGYLQEEIVWTLLEGPGILRPWDFVTTGSAEGRDQLARIYPLMCMGGEIQRKLVVTGYPPLDTFETLNRDACREKFGLAPGERALLFIPAARPHGLPWWRRAAFDGPLAWAAPALGLPSYRRVAAAVMRYAERHQATILVKTRAKNRDPEWLTEMGRVIGDESWYPHTTLELLKAVDLYVGIASATAVEAAAAGVPGFHIMTWPDVANVPGYVPFRRRFFHDSLLWAPAVRADVDPRRLEHWAEEAEWQISSPKLEALAIHPMAGPVDGRASERVMDLVEKPR